MSKKPTKRAQAQAKRNALIKSAQAEGMTKRAAAKFIEQQNDNAKRMGKQITSADAAALAKLRIEGAVANSRSRKTQRGAVYADRMEARDRILNEMASRGYRTRKFIDMAEAAAEGRYAEALRINQKAYEENIAELEGMIQEQREHLQHATGDERIEIENEIKVLSHDLDEFIEQAGMYGIGKPLNLKNTNAAKSLGDLL